MDLKYKGPKWVGNIYQKFEAICLEVDDFVSQDTVKYVENQVQTVGDSMKRFCSDVVQDLIPSSMVKPAIHEAEAVSPTQNSAGGTQVRSMIAFEESDLSFGPEVDALKDNRCDIVLEQEDTKDELVEKKFNIDIEAKDTEDGVMDEKSHMAVVENGMKEEQLQAEEFELICAGNEDVTEASLLSTYIGEKNGISFLDDVECVSDISSTLTPSEMDSSVVSTESRVPEVGLISSRSSLSIGTYGMSDFSDENAIGGVSDLSDAPSSCQSYPMLICDNKVADMGLTHTLSNSALSLESKDTSTTEDAASRTGSSANMHNYCYECARLEVMTSSLEIGEAHNCRVDITDPSMVTIELPEKAKLDEGCIVVDSKLLYADSCRAQRHRSYKKILQDAFASKKRIKKEYEQLGILYGDIDIEQRPHNLLLPTSSLDSNKSSFHDTSDPEWELL